MLWQPLKPGELEKKDPELQADCEDPGKHSRNTTVLRKQKRCLDASVGAASNNNDQEKSTRKMVGKTVKHIILYACKYTQYKDSYSYPQVSRV